MDLFDLTGKTAIVVGGSKGIGYGVAVGLSRAGADVVIVSRKQNELDEAAQMIANETGGKVIGISADICSVKGCYALVEKVATQFGHIDILYNGAGLNIRKSVLDYEEDDWDRVMDVQIKYVFFMSQAVAKHMIANNIKGKIINVGSINCEIAIRNIVAYVTAKGGISQITMAMANELADYGIGVNAIGPGYVITEMTQAVFDDPENMKKFLNRIPLRRIGLPEDMAGLCVFLASEASDYVTGQTITIDGGWTIC